MKTLLAALVLFTAVKYNVLCCPVCEGDGLKCYTCVANNQDECHRQGSSVCPAHADACAIITGPNSVMKSCSYKSFCDKSHMSNGESRLECCFSDECNGPHHSHNHGENNAALTLRSSPVLLLLLLVPVLVSLL